MSCWQRIVAFYNRHTRSGAELGYPHAGKDHRLFGKWGAKIQKALTVENVRTEPISLTMMWPPFILLNIGYAPGKVLRMAAGYRYDRNAHALIFPEAEVKVTDTAILY